MLQPSVSLSREAYLNLEHQAELKHEYYAGQAFAMAGGSFRHARVAGNIYTSLANALRGRPCQPMNSDMRVHTTCRPNALERSIKLPTDEQRYARAYPFWLGYLSRCIRLLW